MRNQKSFEAVNINIQNDIKRANKKELNEIYNVLKQLLSDFDNDTFFKNAKDYLKKLFSDKRKACLFILNDLFDSKDSLNQQQKDSLLIKLNKLSDIHRGFIEDAIRFLGLM